MMGLVQQPLVRGGNFVSKETEDYIYYKWLFSSTCKFGRSSGSNLRELCES